VCVHVCVDVSTNAARGKRVLQSTYSSTFIRNHATDGNTNTVTCTSGFNYVSWIAVDLGQPKFVRALAVTNDNAYGKFVKLIPLTSVIHTERIYSVIWTVVGDYAACYEFYYLHDFAYDLCLRDYCEKLLWKLKNNCNRAIMSLSSSLFSSTNIRTSSRRILRNFRGGGGYW
jgi:hypothetical protein